MQGYDAVRKTSGFVDRSGSGRLRITGPDRAAWLQGLLTNDIAALTPGTGCYATFLTAQGRMISDMRVLECGEFMLLDVPAGRQADVRERLERFIITEDVAIEDVKDVLGRVGVYGPSSPEILERLFSTLPDEAHQWTSLRDYDNRHASFAAQPAIVAASRKIGHGDIYGFDLYVPTESVEPLVETLAAADVERLDDEAWHTLRVEAGRPLFGVDMDTDTIPLEAGIEERAISFTKGCYVGQEVIIRVMHRGGGRVAKRLVGFEALSADAWSSSHWLQAGAPLFAGERQIGTLTSHAFSPWLSRAIALGYVHRDFTEPGTVVRVGASGEHEARLTALPFVGPSA